MTRPYCWTVIHSFGAGFCEGLLESRARARLQKRLLDEDLAEQEAGCRHRVIPVYNHRLVTAEEALARRQA